MLKYRKTENRNGQQNLKTEVFQYKNRKTDLKNGQNRKSQGLKRIIPDNRHNSSFEKDREEAKAHTLVYRVKVAAKKRNATGHR